MDSLGFDDIRFFARLAALGTLSAVARERNVPVSRVSRALARVEKTCGARLVHRSTHALALTPEGEIFLAYCGRLHSTLEELQGEFAAQAGSPSGLVRVAASSVIAQYLIVPSLRALGEQHPLLRVELETSDLQADMAREGIDIAIRTTTQLPETVVARPIAQLARALYAAPAYLARVGVPRQPEDLRSHRLVTNSAAPHLNAWPFHVGGQPLSFAAEGWCRANDTATTATMVLAGLGIGRLASLAAEPLVREGRLVPVLPDLVDLQPKPIHAVTAAARQRLPKIRACIEFWAAWFAQAVPGLAAQQPQPRRTAA